MTEFNEGVSSKEELQRELEEFISQGLELIKQKQFLEAIKYFEDSKIADQFEFDVKPAATRRFRLEYDPSAEEAMKLVDELAQHSWCSYRTSGRVELIMPKAYVIQNKKTGFCRTPKVDIYIPTILQEDIALLHAEEWIHGLQHLSSDGDCYSDNKFLKLISSDSNDSQSEIGVAVYLEQHGVEMTKPFLSRDNRGKYLAMLESVNHQKTKPS